MYTIFKIYPVSRTTSIPWHSCRGLSFIAFWQLCPHATFCSSIYFSSFSTIVFGKGGVRRELMQRLLAALHGTLNSYLHDALQKGNGVTIIWYAFMFLGLRHVDFFLLFPFWLMIFTSFPCKKMAIYPVSTNLLYAIRHFAPMMTQHIPRR
jgi:hypothetical protein